MRRPALHIGCAGFPVDPSTYMDTLAFVEVQDTFEGPPAAGTGAWPGGRDLARALVAWRVITHPRGAGNGDIPEHAAVGHFVRSRWTDEAWERMDALARDVGAHAVLLRTPDSFVATDEHATRLENFVAHAQRPGLQLAWEWGGAWTIERAIPLCERLGLSPVVDPLTGDIPEGDAVYLRVSSSAAPIAGPVLERLAARVRGRTGCVVFSGASGFEDAGRLAALL